MTEMIRVNKSPNVPPKLRNEGATQCTADLAEYLANSALYTNNTRRAAKKKFDNGIYGCSEVKDQLKRDQHFKCCYCESKFTANSPGDVEHFRPKGGYKIPGIRGLNKPGYYWLAYEWSNLFFSCEECNRSNKKNYFPLLDEAKRATPHDNPNSLSDESPLLICPSEDPSNHIEFDKDIIKGRDERGDKSIEYYGLKRSGILEKRLARFKELESAKILSGDLNSFTEEIANKRNEACGENYSVDEWKDIISSQNELITEAISDAGEFSLMARVYFKFNKQARNMHGLKIA
jgi:5-methylcytosine-specific restriction endonuclease McrA